MRAPATSSPISGSCDPQFEAVREAFRANFALHGEKGAAVCVAVEGRVVVDLVGGYRDSARTQAWTADTLVNIFSVGKGMVALAAASLAGTGRLDIDATVASVWPEFAAGGKGDVTVRQLLAHQAGLPAVREPLPAPAKYDWTTMTTALAAQEPWWDPGSDHGYHVNTYGFLVGELVRRVTGEPVQLWLRDNVWGPLDADIHLGFGPELDRRIADFDVTIAFPPVDPTTLEGDQLMQYMTYQNPEGISGTDGIDNRAWRAAVIPSTNTHGTARGVARIYRALAAGGSFDGVRIVSPDALLEATTVASDGIDRVLGRPSRFGLGFQLTQPERPLGPNLRSFGHFGAGGSLGFCDPDAEVALGYVMNDFGPRWQNPRNRGLVDAVYASLG